MRRISYHAKAAEAAGVTSQRINAMLRKEYRPAKWNKSGRISGSGSWSEGYQVEPHDRGWQVSHTYSSGSRREYTEAEELETLAGYRKILEAAGAIVEAANTIGMASHPCLIVTGYNPPVKVNKKRKEEQ
jgi:hypothetical protein